MLARQFLKNGWKVCFISDPITPFHLLKGFELNARLKNYFSGGCRQRDDALWGYVPGGLVMPYNLPVLKSAWVHEYWHRLTFPNLAGMIRKNGFGEVDVLYSRTPRQSFLLDEIDHNLSVFRIPDHDAAFFDYNDEVRRREEDLARRVDLTVYTSKPLETYVANLGPKDTLYLPNGVDYEFFSTPANKPPEYEVFSGPVAVHVGSALPERFDFELVGTLADRFKEVNFVFVGPDEELQRRITSRSNVYLLGPRPYESIPGYIQHADVGLILLDLDKNPELVNSTNPLKLYQYLAGGLPVVSLEWDALRDFAPPAWLAKDRQEFIALFAEALSSDRFKKEQLKDYASKFDWNERFVSLQNKLAEIAGSRQKTCHL